ncbi:tetratricopeptide repeat protein [Mangrovivirga cuniculi]|uniref:tetratricopeptide repeat protein n=1 Tax=Mangrovivirga cuniculi TaxID=2715131 RepID=UPI00268782D8
MNSDYYVALGQIEYKAGNYNESLQAFEQASNHSPLNLDIWLDWSFIYYDLQEFAEACNIMEEAIDELPEEAELYYRMTIYLFCEGKYQEAFNYLENALVLDFEKHTVLYEFFPKLETQKALFKIIEQFRNNDN